MARRWNLVLVALLTGGSMSIPLWTASEVGANNVIAPSVALLDNGSPASSVRGGDTVTLRASAPVQTVGTETVEMVANWSSATAAISGASDVTAPAGWTTTYTTDGTNYVANPANWSDVIGVKATGPVASGGATATSGPNPVITQSLTASAGGTVRPTLGNFQGGAAGDGWNAFHGDGYIFNIYHHADSPNWGIDCHVRASTGSKCWTSLNGAAFTVSGYDSPARSAGYADEARDRVWSVVRSDGAPAATNLGFLCISYAVNPPVVCPSVGVNGYVGLGSVSTDSYGRLGDLVEYQGRLYTKSLDPDSPILCLDVSEAVVNSADACDGSPFFGVPEAEYDSPAGAWNTDRMKRFGNRIYVTTNQRFFDCFDLATNLRCDEPAWPVTASAATFVGPLFAVTSDSGTDIEKICMHSGAGGRCYEPDGTDPTTLPNLPATSGAAWDGWGDNFNHFALDRYYYTNGVSSFGCYDFSTNDLCDGYSQGSILGTYVYALTVDPVDVYCLWSNADRDANKIRPFNALTGSIGCAPLNPTIDFTAPSLLTRLPCTSNNALRKWSSLKVTPGSQLISAANAKLTVLKDGQVNQAVAGFTDVAASAQGTWDLSGLAISASGREPKFAISWASGNLTGTTVQLTYESDPSQLCVDLTVKQQCPSGSGQSATASFSGSSVAVGGSVKIGNAEPVLADATATAADQTDCLGTIAGTVIDGGSPVEGAMVTALMPDASLVQATTNAQGQYSIPRLYPGAYPIFCHAVGETGAAQPVLAETVVADTTTTKNCTLDSSSLRAPDITKTVRVGEAATFPITGTGVEIDPTLTKLIEPGTAASVSALSISGQPAWSIANGVPQTPAFDTIGTYRVVYQIETSTGEQARGLLTLDVIARGPGLPARPSTTIPSPTGPPSTTAPPVLRDPLPPVPITLVPNGPAVLPSIPPGQVLVTENGEVVETQIEQIGDAAWQMTGRDFQWQMQIPALGDQAGSDRGVVTLLTNRKVEISGFGFKGESLVDLWLFSDPTFIGTVRVDANGNFVDDFDVPAGITPGEHTLQASGVTPDGVVRTLNLGVRVLEGRPTLPVTGGATQPLVYWAIWMALLGLFIWLSRRTLRPH